MGDAVVDGPVEEDAVAMEAVVCVVVNFVADPLIDGNHQSLYHIWQWYQRYALFL